MTRTLTLRKPATAGARGDEPVQARQLVCAVVYDADGKVNQRGGPPAPLPLHGRQGLCCHGRA